MIERIEGIEADLEEAKLALDTLLQQEGFTLQSFKSLLKSLNED